MKFETFVIWGTDNRDVFDHISQSFPKKKHNFTKKEWKQRTEKGKRRERKGKENKWEEWRVEQRGGEQSKAMERKPGKGGVERGNWKTILYTRIMACDLPGLPQIYQFHSYFVFYIYFSRMQSPQSSLDCARLLSFFSWLVVFPLQGLVRVFLWHRTRSHWKIFVHQWQRQFRCSTDRRTNISIKWTVSSDQKTLTMHMIPL